MNNHNDPMASSITAEAGFVISDYVDSPEDRQEIAIQLCSMLSSAGTRINENGDFVMDAAQLKPFAALLHRNRLIAGRGVRRYYKRRSRRVLDQIPEEDIEHSLTSEKRAERDRFGLGSTLRGKVLAIENPLPSDVIPPASTGTDEMDDQPAFEVGEVVLTHDTDTKSYLPGEVFNPDNAPPIVRVLKPEEEVPHYLVAVYPHGGLDWFPASQLWHTDAALLKRLETASTPEEAKAAFRIAQAPEKWRDSFQTSIEVMVEARKAHDIEHDDKKPAKPESPDPEDKEVANGDGDEEGSNNDDETYEDLRPSRNLRSHAHLMGPDRFQVGELVLGKLQGHPPWPGKIADPHKLPYQIAMSCPDRDDPNVYPIRFYPDGDYWWVKHGDIVRLDQERVAKFVRETRANFGPLLEGYKIARDPREWEANNPTGDDVVDLYLIELPEKPKPKEPTPKLSHKRKRGGHRDESSTPQPFKKRKRANGEFEDGELKPRKHRKSQVNGDEHVNGEMKEEEMPVDVRPPPSPRTAALEAAQEKKNRLLKVRWLLQKTFLGEKQLDHKFDDASRVLDELATIPMTGLLLRETKLQKVLMGISKLDYLREDEKYNFRQRARAINKSWEGIPIPPDPAAPHHPGHMRELAGGQGRRSESLHAALSTGTGAYGSPLMINTSSLPSLIPRVGKNEEAEESGRLTSVPRGGSTPGMPLTALPSGMEDTPVDGVNGLH